MEYIAFGVGLVIGFVFLRTRIDYILIILSYVLFKSRHGFDAMYSAADDETTYNYIKPDIGLIKTYAQYLRIHASAQPSSHERFSRYYKTVAKMLYVRVIPILLLPTIFFWSNWYYYLIGIATVLLGLLTYRRFVKGYSFGTYQRLIILAVLKDYMATNNKVS